MIQLFVVIASVALMLLFAVPLSNGTSIFGLIGRSSAESHDLEIKYMFDDRILEGDAEVHADLVQIYENVIDTEKSCEFCTYIVYTPGPLGYAEVRYADITPHDLSGARKMTFFIMGEKGGEVASFGVAGKAPDGGAPATDGDSIGFESMTRQLTLTKKWQKVEVDLRNGDLTDITHPLSIRLLKSADGSNVGIYIKHMMFESDDPVSPIRATRST